MLRAHFGAPPRRPSGVVCRAPLSGRAVLLVCIVCILAVQAIFILALLRI
jgi:hypothetical protein